ncbi:MAG: glycosyltransferase, partial [Bacteroidales bacterium]|nr:glycosyltransferase [Bacteroidales bacterium]
GLQVSYFTIKGKGFTGYLKNIFLLRKYLKLNKVDLIHAHYSLSAIVATLSTSLPVVCSLMGSDIQVKGFLKKIILFFSRYRWKATIVKSTRMKRSIGINHAHVVPNGIDLNNMRIIDKIIAQDKTGFESLKKNILFLANPNRYEKNFKLAQESINLLNKLNNENVELHIVYDIEHDLVPYYLNASDVLLLTSLWEGSPNVIKEAMACNLPIVSTDVGDVSDIIEKTQGCYITDFDALDIADKLEKALAFGKRTNGRQNIAYLDDNIIAKKLIDIYNQVLHQNQKYEI